MSAPPPLNTTGQAPSPCRELHLTLAGRLDEIARLGREVEAFGQRAGLDLAVVDAVNIALDELVTNVICHGDASATGGIQVVLAVAGHRLTVEVTDDGRPFDPLSRPAPDTTLDIDSRPVGGLGIHFVRTLMDEISYRREGGCNRVRLAKTLA